MAGARTKGTKLLKALKAQAKADDAFAAQVDASVERVLTLKDRMGLLPCSGTPQD